MKAKNEIYTTFMLFTYIYDNNIESYLLQFGENKVETENFKCVLENKNNFNSLNINISKLIDGYINIRKYIKDLSSSIINIEEKNIDFQLNYSTAKFQEADESSNDDISITGLDDIKKTIVSEDYNKQALIVSLKFVKIMDKKSSHNAIYYLSLNYMELIKKIREELFIAYNDYVTKMKQIFPNDAFENPVVEQKSKYICGDQCKYKYFYRNILFVAITCTIILSMITLVAIVVHANK